MIVEDGHNGHVNMFSKLFKYITGSNSKNENIDMTVPVSTKWHRVDKNHMEHECCFYLGEAHQENPPKPNNPALYISTRPEMTVYTRYILSKLFSRKI